MSRPRLPKRLRPPSRVRAVAASVLIGLGLLASYATVADALASPRVPEPTRESAITATVHGTPLPGITQESVDAALARVPAAAKPFHIEITSGSTEESALPAPQDGVASVVFADATALGSDERVSAVVVPEAPESERNARDILGAQEMQLFSNINSGLTVTAVEALAHSLAASTESEPASPRGFPFGEAAIAALLLIAGGSLSIPLANWHSRKRNARRRWAAARRRVSRVALDLDALEVTALVAPAQTGLDAAFSQLRARTLAELQRMESATPPGGRAILAVVESASFDSRRLASDADALQVASSILLGGPGSREAWSSLTAALLSGADVVRETLPPGRGGAGTSIQAAADKLLAAAAEAPTLSADLAMARWDKAARELVGAATPWWDVALRTARRAASQAAMRIEHRRRGAARAARDRAEAARLASVSPPTGDPTPTTQRYPAASGKQAGRKTTRRRWSRSVLRVSGRAAAQAGDLAMKTGSQALRGLSVAGTLPPAVAPEETPYGLPGDSPSTAGVAWSDSEFGAISGSWVLTSVTLIGLKVEPERLLDAARAGSRPPKRRSRLRRALLRRYPGLFPRQLPESSPDIVPDPSARLGADGAPRRFRWGIAVAGSAFLALIAAGFISPALQDLDVAARDAKSEIQFGRSPAGSGSVTRVEVLPDSPANAELAAQTSQAVRGVPLPSDVELTVTVVPMSLTEPPGPLGILDSTRAAHPEFFNQRSHEPLPGRLIVAGFEGFVAGGSPSTDAAERRLEGFFTSAPSVALTGGTSSTASSSFSYYYGDGADPESTTARGIAGYLEQFSGKQHAQATAMQNQEQPAQALADVAPLIWVGLTAGFALAARWIWGLRGRRGGRDNASGAGAAMAQASRTLDSLLANEDVTALDAAAVEVSLPGRGRGAHVQGHALHQRSLVLAVRWREELLLANRRTKRTDAYARGTAGFALLVRRLGEANSGLADRASAAVDAALSRIDEREDRRRKRSVPRLKAPGGLRGRGGRGGQESRSRLGRDGRHDLGGRDDRGQRGRDGRDDLGGRDGQGRRGHDAREGDAGDAGDAPDGGSDD